MHHGSIYRFSEDFHSLDSCIISGQKGVGESPAMMKKDGIYYWLSSHTTSWERNDNMYFTATSLSGLGLIVENSVRKALSPTTPNAPLCFL